MNRVYPKDGVAHGFADGEMDLRNDMTLQAEKHDLAAREPEACARERGRADARELPFVRQEGCAEWRFRAEPMVGQAGEILSESRGYAPHFERNPGLATTLNMLCAGLDRTLRNEEAEWDRIRNERVEGER